MEMDKAIHRKNREDSKLLYWCSIWRIWKVATLRTSYCICRTIRVLTPLPHFCRAVQIFHELFETYQVRIHVHSRFIFLMTLGLIFVHPTFPRYP